MLAALDAARSETESALTRQREFVADASHELRTPLTSVLANLELLEEELEGEAREAAAERLCAPDVLTDYGLRTLSSDSPVFGPRYYHRGSIWPFDSWLGWGGLRAAGRLAEAERVRAGVLAALDRLGRAPELYAVSDDRELEPVALSNRVQAWTIGARWALEHEWDGR
jgi:glycogen debranching enzyme